MQTQRNLKWIPNASESWKLHVHATTTDSRINLECFGNIKHTRIYNLNGISIESQMSRNP